MRRLEVAMVHVADAGLGFLGSIVVHDTRVWAVGGTYHRPTCLYSNDGGRSFVRWATPPTPGLRDVHIEDEMVWVVGEYGMVAKTKTTDGANWKRVKIDAPGCLYAITRDAQNRMWILGDDGLVLRSKTGKRFERVANQSSTRLLNLHVEPTCVWLVDSGGMLQRTHGKVFVEVPLNAMRAKRPLTALVRTHAGTLLLLGDGGLVLRSTNDGASWKKISIAARVDLEKVLVTRYGIFILGDRGSLLVSHDDGKSFQGLESDLTGHLWSIAEVGGELLIGGEGGRLWRVERKQLALLLRAAFTKRDPVIAELASRVHDGDEGAELVLDDALRERELW